jgi:hypothetical protein
VTSRVIEQPDLTLDHWSVSGRIDAVIGGVVTDEAVVNVTVAGDPMVIDLVVEERVAEGEGFGDTLRTIATDGQTFAGINLDDAGAKGLVRLLNQAIALREQAQGASRPRERAGPGSEQAQGARSG